MISLSSNSVLETNISNDQAGKYRTSTSELKISTITQHICLLKGVWLIFFSEQQLWTDTTKLFPATKAVLEWFWS